MPYLLRKAEVSCLRLACPSQKEQGSWQSLHAALHSMYCSTNVASEASDLMRHIKHISENRLAQANHRAEPDSLPIVVIQRCCTN